MDEDTEVATDDGGIDAELMREMATLSSLWRDEKSLPIEVRALRAARQPDLYGQDLSAMTAREVARLAPAIQLETGVDLVALQRQFGGPAEPKAAAPVAPPRQPIRVSGMRAPQLPYRHIARMLAEGMSVQQVARLLGVGALTIERNMGRSARFRAWIAAEKRAIADRADAAANFARAEAAGHLKRVAQAGQLALHPQVTRRILDFGAGSKG